ncbi:MAG: response regulator transcription factor [Gemmatimonadales bacterium]|nr:response regulator transcription factor [Gemmatimonadales bacterium]
MIRTKRVLIADDHKMFCEGLVGALEPRYRVVGMVHRGSDVLDEIERLSPDVALVDVSMPGQSGIDVARRMKKLGWRTKVIILTMHDDALFAVEALRADASGFVLKHSPRKVLLTAIEKALEGESYMDPAMAKKLKAYSRAGSGDDKATADEQVAPGVQLTQRQREVLRHLVLGSTTAETADALGLSVKAIEFHRGRLKKLLGVSTTAGLIHYTISHHIFE